MSSSLFSPSLLATLATPPAQKLTRSNFIFWKTLVLLPICGALAFGLLDGIKTAQAQTLEVKDAGKNTATVPNPAYLAWVAQDQAVIEFLVTSLALKVVAHVDGLTHAS
jgi:hypothetical protein